MLTLNLILRKITAKINSFFETTKKNVENNWNLKIICDCFYIINNIVYLCKLKNESI